MAEPLLSIRELSVAYVTDTGLAPAVRELSLDIHRGELVGLVGESGSGKSTVAQALLRILGPPGVITGGEALFGGRDLLALGADELATVRWREASIVLQSALNALSPVHTIGRQFEHTLTTHQPELGAERVHARSCELLELVELETDLLDSYPHELSGGMRQRVVLAMALALQPELVIFDEPTTALDVLVERQILRRVLELQAQLHFAVLFITHDLHLLLEVVDRVGVMRDGVLVEVADRSTLAAGGHHPVTRALLASLPTTSGPRDPDLVPLPTRQPDPGSEPLLVVEGLGKTFRRPDDSRLRAVDGLSFTLRRGEVVGLVGGSGSGKSTVARLLARLIRADDGTVRLDGQDWLGRRARPEVRRRLQLVFQDPFASLNPVHTVVHHVARPLLRHRLCDRAEVRGRVEALLETVGLSPGGDFLDRHPHALSGGQRQRVAIARALATEPDLLIADEPTSMLDVTLRLDVLRLLARLRDERGLAILLITHDLASARYLADRILVLQEGRLVEEGPSETLVTAPTHPYARRLVEAAAPGWSTRETP